MHFFFTEISCGLANLKQKYFDMQWIQLDLKEKVEIYKDRTLSRVKYRDSRNMLWACVPTGGTLHFTKQMETRGTSNMWKK